MVFHTTFRDFATCQITSEIVHNSLSGSGECERTPYRVAVVFRRRHFRAKPAFTRDSQQQLPMSTTAFEDSESLGEAWHAVGGFGNSLAALANGQMLMLLQNNPEFALRCARSPPEFFFGPTKELLHEVALQLRAAWIRQRWQRVQLATQRCFLCA